MYVALERRPITYKNEVDTNFFVAAFFYRSKRIE